MSASPQFGLGPDGFYPKSQSQIISEISTSIQTQFGSSAYLGADSVWAKLIGIVAERQALLWQLGQSIYQAQFPSGSEGIAVDNLLALSSLQRLPATPSVTDPTPARAADGTTLYGLVLYGTVGTTIPKGALISTSSTPSQTFTLDAPVTIQAAVNAQQTLILSDVPTQGTYALTLVNAGTTLTTRTVPFSAQANVSQLSFATPPSSGSFAFMLGSNLIGPLPANVTAAQLQAILVAMGGTLASATVTSTTAGFAISWGQGVYNPLVQTAPVSISFASSPITGSFALNVGGTVSAPIVAPFSAATIQAALLAMGYQRARVASAGTNAFALNIDRPVVPTVSIAQNTTGAAATVASFNTTGSALGAVDSLQGVLNNLLNPTSNLRPYSDAVVIPSATGFALTFGAGPPRTGEPSSAATPIGLIVVNQSSLQKGNAIVNLSVTGVASGSPAQGVGSATATVNGPNLAAAGVLSVISSPSAGWSSVTNQLDVLPGSLVESDQDALIRRNSQLSSRANGPLPSIIGKVSLLPGVSNVAGFVNATDAAIQILTFAQVPTSGSFALLLSGGQTAAIPYSANAGGIQQAINAVPGYQNVNVTGNVAYALNIDFNGSYGGQSQALIQVVSNTTGVAIATAYGRPSRAIELVVQGGDTAQIAQTIFNSTAAGISTYGSPAAVTTGSTASNSAVITVASAVGIVPGLVISGLGIQPGARVVSVAGAQVTLSSNAVGAYSGVTLTFTNAVTVRDVYGNASQIAFSRPTPLLFYVTVSLLTDQYRTPGVPASGANSASQFQPSTMAQIQRDIVAIGNATPIGGLVIGFGTKGLIGAFNEIPGVVGYTVTFGTSPNPTSNQNVQMLPTQVATFQQALVSVSYS